MWLEEHENLLQKSAPFRCTGFPAFPLYQCDVLIITEVAIRALRTVQMKSIRISEMLWNFPEEIFLKFNAFGEGRL